MTRSSAASVAGNRIAWSGRLLLPASSLGTTLAIITVPLYRLWNTSGFVMLLTLIVAGWLATAFDGVWAYLSLRNPSLALKAPLTMVGEPTRVQITDASPSGALLELADPVLSPVGLRIGDSSSLVACFGRRGVFSAFLGEMTVVGPLGIVSCRRRFTVRAEGGIVVGPQPDEAPRLPEPAATSESSDRGVVGRGADLTRTVRPYLRGDAQSAVAWKSSARAGELMVREVEGVVDDELVLALQVSEVRSSKVASSRSGLDARSEEAVRRCAGYVLDALRKGKVVHLITNQEEALAAPRSRPPRFGKVTPADSVGSVTVQRSVVRNETELLHRLAAVVPGADLRRDRWVSGPGASPAFVVSPTGDQWVGNTSVGNTSVGNSV